MLEKLAQYLERILYPVSRTLNGVGSGVILGMVVLMTVNVILRYLFERPIKGAVELEEFISSSWFFWACPMRRWRKGMSG